VPTSVRGDEDAVMGDVKEPAGRLDGDGLAGEVAPDVVAVLEDADAPNRLRGALTDGEWKPWVIGGAAVWLFLRLAEIRYLRRLNRAAFVRAAA